MRERVRVSKIEEIVDSGVEGFIMRDLKEARVSGGRVSHVLEPGTCCSIEGDERRRGFGVFDFELKLKVFAVEWF